MKFILVSPKNRTSYNFRGDLIKEIIARGYEVVVTGPNRDHVEKIEQLGARFVEIPMKKMRRIRYRFAKSLELSILSSI